MRVEPFQLYRDRNNPSTIKSLRFISNFRLTTVRLSRLVNAALHLTISLVQEIGQANTSFSYSDGSLISSHVKAGDPIEVSVQIKNVGAIDGDETIEAYLIPRGESGAPRLWLAGFRKIHLLRGETRAIRLVIDARQMSIVDADGTRSIHAGQYELYVGQPSAHSGVMLPFQITGEMALAP